jgi:hypothetical protein
LKSELNDAIFACRNKKAVKQYGSVAQLDRASHYGCEGFRFES